MTKNIGILISAIFLSCTAFTFLITHNWQVKDENYVLKFDTRWVKGNMKGLKGTIDFDEKNFSQSNFDVSIDVNTISTGNKLEDKHAKAEGFFNAEKYPNIKFKSTKFEKVTSGFQVSGNLTIKETTKLITIPYTFDNKGNEGNFKGNFSINRSEYGLKKMGVGETIKIELQIPVKK
jgi:polyisoprenoid-binding protein YceI